MTNYTLTANAGAFALSGVSASFFYGYALAADAGSFALTGLDETLVPTFLVSEGVVWAPTASYLYQGGGTVSESILCSDPAVTTTKYSITQTEGAKLFDAPSLAFLLTLTEGVTLHDAQIMLRGWQVLEKLVLSDTTIPQTRYSAAVLEVIRWSDALQAFFNKTISENVVITDQLSQMFVANITLQQGLAVFDALSNNLFMRIDVEEGVALTHSQLVHGIYSGTISENIDIRALYVSPDGGITTWAINTRTGAVTEYKNFEFVSFAQLGDKFIGATSDGLYELDGATDDGENIATRMRGGILQINGSRFTGMKAMYIGVRMNDTSSQDMFLKLEAGDGRSYVYAIKPQNMMTTKVTTGKGLRSRYFQWELVSVAADFDLDTIEFVPMSSNRHV